MGYCFEGLVFSCQTLPLLRSLKNAKRTQWGQLSFFFYVSVYTFLLQILNIPLIHCLYLTLSVYLKYFTLCVLEWWIGPAECRRYEVPASQFGQPRVSHQQRWDEGLPYRLQQVNNNNNIVSQHFYLTFETERPVIGFQF